MSGGKHENHPRFHQEAKGPQYKQSNTTSSTTLSEDYQASSNTQRGNNSGSRQPQYQNKTNQSKRPVRNRRPINRHRPRRRYQRPCWHTTPQRLQQRPSPPNPRRHSKRQLYGPLYTSNTQQTRKGILLKARPQQRNKRYKQRLFQE